MARSRRRLAVPLPSGTFPTVGRVVPQAGYRWDGTNSRPSAAVTAAAVIRHEAAALDAAAGRLDPVAFARAVELLVDCAGTVATTGAGTSGIVARKIAATLTSIGTPALFLHPADALHGGLGIIGSQEVVIAVSNGGETDEVLSLLPYLAGRDVPLIVLVGNLQSTLARRATVAIEARAEREADPQGFVPTASVTVALAVADALALTVMEMKGITPERFAFNHPSGRLGRRLTLRVRDVMHFGEECPTVGETATLLEAVGAISRGGAGAVLIIDDEDRLLGLVTDGDVRRTSERTPDRLMDLHVADVMTGEPTTVDANTMAYDALRLMEDRPSQISVLPVVRLHDLVRIGL